MIRDRRIAGAIQYAIDNHITIAKMSEETGINPNTIKYYRKQAESDSIEPSEEAYRDLCAAHAQTIDPDEPVSTETVTDDRPTAEEMDALRLELNKVQQDLTNANLIIENLKAEIEKLKKNRDYLQTEAKDWESAYSETEDAYRWVLGKLNEKGLLLEIASDLIIKEVTK